MLGVGPFPARGSEDVDLVNAGKQVIASELPSNGFWPPSGCY